MPHSKGAIDYKSLRSFNAEMFSITRAVVYDILRKEREANLRDRSRAPRHQPGKTPAEVEDKVVALKNKTHLGPERLSRYLKEYEGMVAPGGAIGHILRRNKTRLEYGLRPHRWRKEKPEFVDWYSAKPFEIVQMDIKRIRDHKALSKEQMVHLDRYQIPNYQWGALDVNSRFKMIGYSREKSWTNGLCWYLWVHPTSCQ